MRYRLPPLALCVAIPLALLDVAGALALIPDRGGDFQMIYNSTAAWAAGHAPYAVTGTPTTNLNHPVLWLVVWPFLQFSPINAFIAWTLLSIALLAATAIWMAPVVGISAWETTILTLAATGTAFELGLGQIAFLLMVLLTGAWWCERTGRNAAAGACIGLLCVLKPFFGLFPLMLIWRRAYRNLTTCVLTVVGGYLLGWLLAGNDGYAAWLENLRHVTWTWHIFNGSIWGASSRMFEVQQTAIGTRWTPLLVSPLAAHLFVALGIVATLFVLWRGLRSANIDEQYALVALASLLLSPLGWVYNLPVLVGPVLSVLARRPSRWLWPIGALALWPYPLLVNRQYGKLGTATVGQISTIVVAGLLLAVYASVRARARNTVITPMSQPTDQLPLGLGTSAN